MAGEFSAGSVLVELKAQYTDLKKNVQGAKAEVTGFGTSVDATAKKVTASGQQITSSFDAIDRKSVQLVGKLARLTGAMVVAQGAFQSFAGDGQNKGIAAASAGLSTFASIALVMPHPVGLAIAAVAGLTAGILKFIETAPRGTEAAREFGESMRKAAEAQRDLRVDLAFIARTKTGTERDQAILGVQRKAQEDIIREQLLDQERTRGIFQRGEMTADLADRNLQDSEEQIKLARSKLRDIAAAESVKDRQMLAEQNKLLMDATAIQLQGGLISPLEAVQVEAQAARKELDKLLANPNKDMTAIGLAIDKAKAAQQKVETEKRLGDLADNFADAIGRGLTDAILSAKSPMEALASFGSSLFSSMIQDLMKDLKGGLRDLLSGSGLGSAGIGAITGILGIGGAVLSHLGSSATSSFGNVQSAITSSEQTRGIIAGPSSVAIAAVGENLQRAMAPVVARLDISNQLLAMIARNTRGSRNGSGGGMEVDGVAVATDLT